MAIAGPLIGGITGLIGAMMQAQAQAQANQMNWRNLQFQQQQANKGNRLATATRTDAYGNKMSYDELLNEWINQLTPTQESILKAGEQEQYRTLTEDATRQREARRAQEGRSKEAGKEFDKALVGYRYDQPPSEGKAQADLVQSLLINRQKGLGEGLKALTGQAQRLGRGADIPKLLQQADQLFGESLEDVTLKGKQAGSALASSQRAEHENRYGGALDRFATLADRINPVTPRYSDAPTSQANVQEAMARAIQAAIGNSSANVGNAYTNLATGLARSPDLSGIASALSGLSFGGDKSDPNTFSASQVTPDRPWWQQGIIPNDDERLQQDVGAF